VETEEIGRNEEIKNSGDINPRDNRLTMGSGGEVRAKDNSQPLASGTGWMMVLFTKREKPGRGPDFFFF
jgi:hypothetical protein